MCRLKKSYHRTLSVSFVRVSFILIGAYALQWTANHRQQHTSIAKRERKAHFADVEVSTRPTRAEVDETLAKHTLLINMGRASGESWSLSKIFHTFYVIQNKWNAAQRNAAKQTAAIRPAEAQRMRLKGMRLIGLRLNGMELVKGQ